MLQNPARVVPAQERFIRFGDAGRYRPVKRAGAGVIILKDTTPGEPEELVSQRAAPAAAAAAAAAAPAVPVIPEEEDAPPPGALRLRSRVCAFVRCVAVADAPCVQRRSSTTLRRERASTRARTMHACSHTGAQPEGLCRRCACARGMSHTPVAQAAASTAPVRTLALAPAGRALTPQRRRRCARRTTRAAPPHCAPCPPGCRSAWAAPRPPHMRPSPPPAPRRRSRSRCSP